MSAIQRAGPDAAAALSALHSRAFPPAEAWDTAAFTALLALETSWVYTANSASAVQGLMVLQVTEMEADLLTVCVDPACQRAGLGRGLLLFGMDALWQSGVKVLRLDVAADNAAAIAFYRAFGFDDDGRRLKYYRRGNGVRVDGVLMSRSLAGHGATKKA